jgi:hypothetical protein
MTSETESSEQLKYKTGENAMPWQLDAISIGPCNNHAEETAPLIREVHDISCLGKTSTPRHNDGLRIKG